MLLKGAAIVVLVWPVSALALLVTASITIVEEIVPAAFGLQIGDCEVDSHGGFGLEGVVAAETITVKCRYKLFLYSDVNSKHILLFLCKS